MKNFVSLKNEIFLFYFAVIEVECEKTAVQLTSPAANLLTTCKSVICGFDKFFEKY